MDRRFNQHPRWLAAVLFLTAAASPLLAETRRPAETASAEAQQKKLKAIIREFPRAFALTDPSTDRKTFALRLGISFILLADRFSVPLEVLKEDLGKTAETALKDKSATRMEKAAARFLMGDFAEAESLALDAGDEAHRDQPRRPATIVEALQLAAFAAIVQRHYADAHRYLGVAIGEADPDRDLTLWAEIQVTQSHLEWLSDQPEHRIRTLRGIFEACQKSLGNEHSATLRHHNELASALYDHNRDAEAEKEFRAVLEVMQRITEDPDGPAIQTLRKNLAKVIEAQKRYADALPLRQSIVKSQSNDLGPEDPETLHSRVDLAMNFSNQQRFEQAATEYAAILDIRQRILGKDDLATRVCRNNLAVALRDGGKYAEALTQFRVLQAQEAKLFGAEDPRTQETTSAIGVCLNDLDRRAEAEKILKELYALRKRTLGAEDLKTLETRNNLANAYAGQRKWEEAEAEYEAVLKARTRLLGPDHPKTLGVRHNLATLRFEDPERTERWIREQKASLAKILAGKGESDELAIMTRLGLADLLRSAGKYAEAEKEYREVLRLRGKTTGAEHPKTLGARSALGIMLMIADQFEEAAAHFEAILEVQERHLDPEDPALYDCMHNLALALAREGKQLDRAKELARLAHDGFSRTVGADHQATVQAKKTLTFLNTPQRLQPVSAPSLQLPLFSTPHPGLTPATPATPGEPLPTIIEPLKLKL